MKFFWSLSEKFSTGLSKLHSRYPMEHFEEVKFFRFAVDAARIRNSPSLHTEGMIFLS